MELRASSMKSSTGDQGLLDLLKQGKTPGLQGDLSKLTRQSGQNGSLNFGQTTQRNSVLNYGSSTGQGSALSEILDLANKEVASLKQELSNQILQAKQSLTDGTSDTASIGSDTTAVDSTNGDTTTTQGTSQTGQVDSTSANSQPMPKDEKDTSVPPSSSTLFKNMDGDNRSADEIIDQNPILKNLGNQKDIKQDDLKKQFGDWTADNKDPQSRALAAKNMSYFLNNVKALKDRDGGDRGDISTNGKIEGLTKDGDARHGTEAAIVKDVAEQGLDKMFPKNGCLTQTNDEMVNQNGTNKSGFQGICLKVGKALSFIPGVSNVLMGMGNAQSDDFGSVLKGGIVGGVKTAWDALKGGIESLKSGKFNPVSFLIGAYKGAVTNTYVADEAKEKAKEQGKKSAYDVIDDVTKFI